MTTITESNRLGDVLKYEAPNLYSRDEVTVANGQNLAVGTVVGILTADGKITALNPGASDGSEIAAGVIANDVDASGGDTASWMVARHAIASDNGLVWPGSINAAQLATATGQLKQLGILIRKGA